MMQPAAGAWERFQCGVAKSGDFSRWPNEAMLKVLFGSYLRNRRVPALAKRFSMWAVAWDRT